MIFVLAATAIAASGLALLRALRLETGRIAVDGPLAWFVGSAWIGLSSFIARGLINIPSGPATSVVVLALPLVAWAVTSRIGRRRGPRDEGARDATGEGVRWMPRPTWLFGPMIAWTLLVAGGVTLHGLNTPVHTDDAFRVRALAPVLAATGAWTEPARQVIAMAGPIPTYVPAYAWTIGAEIDPVGVGATVVLTFLALLLLLVALASTRGTPEAGWGAAFAITSMPFFAYHAASTYADAWLGMFLAAAFAFLIAHGRTGSPSDAGRAMLLLLGASMVKREGEIVAAPVIGLLIVQAMAAERSWRRALRLLAPFVGAYLLLFAARVSAVGVGGAFPFLRAATERTMQAVPAVVASGPPEPGMRGAGEIFLRALLTEGNLGLLWWVLPVSAVLLIPRIRREGLSWSLAALAILLAEAAVSAVWLFPQFTLDNSTVHRSLLPVSAAASVWLGALLAARTPVTGPGVPPSKSRSAMLEGARPAPPVRQRGASRTRSREAPRRRGG